jgi:putative Mn2+ efflux pump MntP
VDPDDTTEPERADSQARAGTRRWLGRLVLVAIGLWFIVDGLRETWPAAGVVARGLLVAAVLLGVGLLVLGLLHLTRRGRGG